MPAWRTLSRLRSSPRPFLLGTAMTTSPLLLSPVFTKKTSRRSGSRRLATALAVAAIGAALVACSPSTTSSASVSTSPSASESASTSPLRLGKQRSAAASGSAVNPIAVTARDFAFGGATTSPAGPTKITLTNEGKEEHQAQLAKIADGKALTDVLTALKKGDQNAAFALLTFSGGPTGVQPGASVSASTKLEPGNYVFLCFFQSADGIPHFAKGMVSGLQVTGTSAGGDLPAGDATVTAKDFSYSPTLELSAGKHTITLKNQGPQPHEAGLIKLAPGVTVDAILKIATATTSPPPGPPPWTDVGGTGAIAQGLTATFEADLQPGNYAFLCFVPDAATGKPHFVLGMISAITVK